MTISCKRGAITMSDNIEKDLKITTGDIVHTIVKAGIGSVPVVGTAASELFNLVLTSPVEKRKEEWMIRIFNTLQEVQEKVESFQIESLANNDRFISIMTRASQLALINHQQEKLQALHNAVINSALNISIDENEQMMFLNMVDTFTPWHLKLVYYFENPVKRFNENIIERPDFMMGGIRDGLYAFYPELANRDEFVGVIFNDLFTYKIINTSSLGGSMTNDGIYASRLVDYGRRFLNFIQYNIE
jgi:hypothetical protein